MKASGVILAGGESKRMGRDKALLEIGTQTLIEKVRDRLKPLCKEILVVSRGDKLEELRNIGGVTLVADRVNSRGPLVGIQAGLFEATNDYVFAVGCDMPRIEARAVQFFLDEDPSFDVVVPALDGYYEPLFARYSRRCLPAIERALEGDRRSVPSFFKSVKVREVSRGEMIEVDPSLASFENLNTPQQWREFKQNPT